MMQMESPPVAPESVLKCPVCAAGFRGMETCPRCGTDLRALMLIAARAWSLHKSAARNSVPATSRAPCAVRRWAGAFSTRVLPFPRCRAADLVWNGCSWPIQSEWSIAS